MDPITALSYALHRSDEAIAAMRPAARRSLRKHIYRAAAELLDRVDRQSIGSGEVVDASTLGGRLCGSVESRGHLATQRDYFVVPTTGPRAWRLDIAVHGLAHGALAAIDACGDV